MLAIKINRKQRARTNLWFLLFISTLIFSIDPQAVAAEEPEKLCSNKIVTARGEASRFDWIARLKTRANWRSKVRAMPELGDRYANWYRAKDADENCASGPAGTVCTFTGNPCKKG